MSGYRWTEAHVLYELPVVRGWAYRNWLVEADPWGSAERDSDGYIGQQAVKILSESVS